MPETATWLAAASDQQGPGYTLRVVLLGSMVGIVLLAWFLLRGYRSGSGDSGADTTAGPGGEVRGETRGEARSEVGAAAGEDSGTNT